MGRKQIRLGVWALAILTSFTIFGDHTAYAWNSQPRVQAGGWFFTPNALAKNGSAKVNIGITGRCDKSGFITDTTTNTETCSMPQGHFEYHNQFTGLQAHGKITSLVFHPVDPTDACALFGPTDNNNNPLLAGKPAATLSGPCDDGSCTSFSIELVDADDSTPVEPDSVCNVNVQGRSKFAPADADSDPNEPLVKGNIEVRNFPPNK